MVNECFWSAYGGKCAETWSICIRNLKWSIGFRVISIPYDELEERPELIRSLIRSLMAPFILIETQPNSLMRIEREILRMAAQIGRVLRPIDVMREYELCHRTAVKYLQQLCDKGRLKPLSVGTGKRIAGYERLPAPYEEWM